MIGYDEPMAVVVKKGEVVKATINLGYANVDGNEYYKLRMMAEKYGCTVQIEQVDLSEVSGFAELFGEVEKAASGR